MVTTRSSLVLAIVLAACGPAAPGPSDTPGASTSVESHEVRSAPARHEAWELTLGVTGELAAFEESDLSTKVPGRLVTLAVDLGSLVKRNELVAAIDARDYELRLAQATAAIGAARADLGLPAEGEDDKVDPESTAAVRLARTVLADAKRTFERTQQLIRDNVGTQAQVDAAETAMQQADNRLQAATEDVARRRAVLGQRRADHALAAQALADTRIVAPFDGGIAMRHANTGDYLAAGAPVARLVRTDPLRLRLRVPERDAAGVRLGQSVRVTFDGDPRAIVAELVRVAPVLGDLSRSLVVEAEVPNPDGVLRPGAFARAKIVLDAVQETLVVPAEALVSFAGIEKVFVVEEGRTVERRVTVGRRASNRVEILEGLTAGEAVLLAPGKLREEEPKHPAR